MAKTKAEKKKCKRQRAAAQKAAGGDGGRVQKTKLASKAHRRVRPKWFRKLQVLDATDGKLVDDGAFDEYLSEEHDNDDTPHFAQGVACEDGHCDCEDGNHVDIEAKLNEGSASDVEEYIQFGVRRERAKLRAKQAEPEEVEEEEEKEEEEKKKEEEQDVDQTESKEDHKEEEKRDLADSKRDRKEKKRLARKLQKAAEKAALEQQKFDEWLQELRVIAKEHIVDFETALTKSQKRLEKGKKDKKYALYSLGLLDIFETEGPKLLLPEDEQATENAKALDYTVLYPPAGVEGGIAYISILPKPHITTNGMFGGRQRAGIEPVTMWAVPDPEDEKHHEVTITYVSKDMFRLSLPVGAINWPSRFTSAALAKIAGSRLDFIAIRETE